MRKKKDSFHAMSFSPVSYRVIIRSIFDFAGIFHCGFNLILSKSASLKLTLCPFSLLHKSPLWSSFRPLVSWLLYHQHPSAHISLCVEAIHSTPPTTVCCSFLVLVDTSKLGGNYPTQIRVWRDTLQPGLIQNLW